MIKYRECFDEINAFEVVKETEKFVTYKNKLGNECREAKTSTFSKWFDTWEDARTQILDKHARNIASYKMRIEIAEKRWREIAAMKEPT